MEFKFVFDKLPIFKFVDEELSRRYLIVFSTRKGGISSGNYRSMNLGTNNEDKKEFVEANMRKFLENFSIDFKNINQVKQVHGADIIEVNSTLNRVVEADGMVTTKSHLPLLMKFADCYPLFLFSKSKNVISLLHCGWRGIYSSIVKKGIFKINYLYDLEPEDLVAVIGPGICMNCFKTSVEVGRNFLNHFAHFPNINNLVELWSDGGMVDLKGIIKEQLKISGLNEDSIIDTNQCTACNDNLFFSHRRDDGLTGRMGALAMIMEDKYE